MLGKRFENDEQPIFDLNNLQILMKKRISNINGVIMDDVLEHLVDPSRDLSLLNDALSGNGYLFLRQMNYNSWGRRLYSKNWCYFQPGAHMYYFEPDSIQKLLKKCGFTVVKIYHDSIRRSLKELLGNILHDIGILQSDWCVGSKKMYLSERKKLADMFLVVARKD